MARLDLAQTRNNAPCTRDWEGWEQCCLMYGALKMF